MSAIDDAYGKLSSQKAEVIPSMPTTVSHVLLHKSQIKSTLFLQGKLTLQQKFEIAFNQTTHMVHESLAMSLNVSRFNFHHQYNFTMSSINTTIAKNQNGTLKEHGQPFIVSEPKIMENPLEGKELHRILEENIFRYDS